MLALRLAEDISFDGLDQPLAPGEVAALCGSHDGLRLASASDDGSVCLWGVV